MTTTRINGNELRKVEGAREVTVAGTTYRIAGTGHEWAVSFKEGGHLFPLFKATSLKAAASELAMRTF